MHKQHGNVFRQHYWVALAFAGAALALCAGCTKKHLSMPHSTLGKVVIYRNGVAYYERTARPVGGKLTVAVPRRLVDDFLKSLTIRDKVTGASIGASFPRRTDLGDAVQMELALPPGTREVVMTYITEAPAWKPSYRVSLPTAPGDTKVRLEGWAIVDNVSGEDWSQVLVGVGSSAAMSFRYDLWSVHKVAREQLASGELFAVAPPESVSPHRGIDAGKVAVAEQAIRADDHGEEREALAKKPATDLKRASGRRNLDELAEAVSTSNGAAATAAPPSAQARLRDEASAIARTADAGARGVKLMQYVDSQAQCGEQTKAQTMRDHLIDVGLNAAKVQVGCEVRPGSASLDVRYVDIASLAAGAGSGKLAALQDGPPIGTALFMAAAPMSVAKDTSAMVSVMQQDTVGEVVYLYDPSGARGNQAFAFRAVRLRNPTGAMLERGPVTFYGNGQFVGEGVTEAIAGNAAVVIPFALDRQIVVEHADTSTSHMQRFIGADRHGFRATIETEQTVAYTVSNRGGEATTVYLRHAVPLGYELGKEVKAEKVGDSYLIAVKVAAGASTTMNVTQSQSYARGYSFADASALGLLRTYLKASPDVAEAPALAKIVAQGQTLETLVEEIASLKERADEWAQREAELRAQIDSFRAAKAGASMLALLTTRLAKVSGKASELALALESARETLLGERIRFVELVAEASADASPDVARH